MYKKALYYQEHYHHKVAPEEEECWLFPAWRNQSIFPASYDEEHPFKC